MENHHIWKQRWQGLEAVIADTEQALPSGFAQEATVRALLRGLRTFGASQLGYFLEHPTPLPWEYPETAVLDQTLAQIAGDLELIERAAYQRAWGGLPAQRTLAWADQWLTQILTSAEHWLPERSQVLAVLCGAPAVNVLPYLGVVMVGVPYTAAGGATAETWPARDWLRLLAELGQAVCRRGQAGAQPLAEAVQARTGDLAAWSAPWLAAVFGEVFAVLSAGPAASLAAQDAALTQPPARFNLAEGVQLPPILTAKVHGRVLAHLALDDWAESLEQRWATRVRQRAAPAGLQLSTPVTEIRLTHPRDEVFALTDAAYDLLRPSLEALLSGWHPRYSRMAPYAPHALETLYADFAGSLARPSAAEACRPALAAPRLAADWPARFISADRRGRAAELAHDIHDWLAVLRADGWLHWPA